MAHLTDNIIQLLKALANQLPQVTVHSHEKHYITGAEILSWDTVKEIDGEAIVPDNTYLWRYPVLSVANHFRRMKNRYRKKGLPGLKEYFEWLISLQTEGEKIQQLEILKKAITEIQ